MDILTLELKPSGNPMLHILLVDSKKQLSNGVTMRVANVLLTFGTMSLTKRIDEIRLLESRKSARLADQDTDFARLADMAGDRKRASSHSIDVPHVMA
ncbi:hypothetical protein G5I_06330 [Acromyrmex echinatior]|uniref:Uncharacterized protein n=1 Tax=Acromyrmex echinatior TaxID=103372 RepID=F4WKR0_ACREC|nr:hypothetical protein G5I_06330 [Acromyrmex echinatior]